MNDPLAQIEGEIHNGEMLVASLRADIEADEGQCDECEAVKEAPIHNRKNVLFDHLYVPKTRVIRQQIREVEAFVAAGKRKRSRLMTRWWAGIAGQEMPAFDETTFINAMAERLREITDGRDSAA